MEIARNSAFLRLSSITRADGRSERRCDKQKEGIRRRLAVTRMGQKGGGRKKKERKREETQEGSANLESMVFPTFDRMPPRGRDV